jgi:glycosidase
MPSKSYHKYDVEDYYDIDENFGTLDDFDTLIEECHKRGINVIIDLVLNHISSQNQLYLDAVEEVAQGKLDGKAEYFEIHKQDYFSADTNVNLLANGYACEANFSPDMPEWNLNSEKTREEFTNIAKFWLDRGVDGFRLDAVKYYTNKSTDGEEFLNWFYTTCQEIKPDVYMVGEDWEDDSYLQTYYKSGIDSLFAFKFAQASGVIIQNMLTQSGASTVSKVKRYNDKMLESNENYINAMFLSNHDQVRAANALEPYGVEFEKFAASVYMLFPGNSFTYYGEEIGMTASETTSDRYYRTGMIFDSENLPQITVDGIEMDEDAPADGGVKQQLENKDSLLSFYQRIIKIKNQNPEIARGTITDTVDFDDDNIGAYYTEYDGSKLLIIHNFNKTDEKELTITDDMLENAEVRADLVTSTTEEHVVLKDGKLTLPALSTVILKTAE